MVARGSTNLVSWKSQAVGCARKGSYMLHLESSSESTFYFNSIQWGCYSWGCRKSFNLGVRWFGLNSRSISCELLWVSVNLSKFQYPFLLNGQNKNWSIRGWLLSPCGTHSPFQMLPHQSCHQTLEVSDEHTSDTSGGGHRLSLVQKWVHRTRLGKIRASAVRVRHFL